jgi:hypothetical protein
MFIGPDSVKDRKTRWHTPLPAVVIRGFTVTGRRLMKP